MAEQREKQLNKEKNSIIRHKRKTGSGRRED